ncbi:MAG: lipoyl synthase [Gammaproteobacteria bacterium]|nr:lipoyl synthase [Gammaproteobacteria bacterium]OUT93726.1 MAG: lipoyl synthase [Gammaproteobacteria bacterium TMED36]|tara:strand:- start:59742 stop:60731 length:990 start_codon:yes stop_codon:yes gene_type:complete
MVIMDNNTLKPISGEKYRHQNGIKAIKDGIKVSVEFSNEKSLKKPDWFKVPIPSGKNFISLRKRVQKLNLSSVCEESKCPNIAECWNHKTATLMVMGSVCTRACKFCAVDTGNPSGWLDKDEPKNIADTIAFMSLDYVVLTSVDRDDLSDGGSSHIARCVSASKTLSPDLTIEVLSPDFKGNLTHLDILLGSGLDVFSQNIETVERLTRTVRDPRAGYDQTLRMLSHSTKKGFVSKSGMMLGLGEQKNEVVQTMKDLFNSGVKILTLGQYLRPTKNHLPVKNYIHPDEFKEYSDIGRKIGIEEVVAGPLIRSSYRADRAFINLEKKKHG